MLQFPNSVDAGFTISGLTVQSDGRDVDLAALPLNYPASKAVSHGLRFRLDVTHQDGTHSRR